MPPKRTSKSTPRASNTTPKSKQSRPPPQSKPKPKQAKSLIPRNHHERAKQKHMENIASSLLAVHTHYFQDSNSSNSSPLTQLTNFLRSSGALHCGTSSITLSDIADICNENNASSSSQMSYDDFYNCFGNVYDLLNPTMKAMSQYQSKR